MTSIAIEHLLIFLYILGSFAFLQRSFYIHTQHVHLSGILGGWDLASFHIS